MKNVPIKFRGADIIADKLYYGDYITRSDGSCAIRFKASSDPFELFDLHEGEIAVKPESVAQLVGYDANGNEVYEGDILDKGKPLTLPYHACLTPTLKQLNQYSGKYNVYEFNHDIAKKFEYFLAKEE